MTLVKSEPVRRLKEQDIQPGEIIHIPASMCRYCPGLTYRTLDRRIGRILAPDVAHSEPTVELFQLQTTSEPLVYPKLWVLVYCEPFLRKADRRRLSPEERRLWDSFKVGAI